jgi:non-ribosomal peptide synthetase component F
VNPARDGEKNPLYNVALLWQEFPGGASFRAPGLEVTPVRVPSQAALLDLRFEVEQEGSDWLLKADYNAELFEPESVTAFMSLLLLELKILARAPETPLDAVASRESTERSWLGRLFHPFTAAMPVTCFDWCALLPALG